ncbi:hypothetical protein PG984_012915 [Apiospora sp. TS-2023a]
MLQESHPRYWLPLGNHNVTHMSIRAALMFVRGCIGLALGAAPETLLHAVSLFPHFHTSSNRHALALRRVIRPHPPRKEYLLESGRPVPKMDLLLPFLILGFLLLFVAGGRIDDDQPELARKHSRRVLLEPLPQLVSVRPEELVETPDWLHRLPEADPDGQ